MLRFTTLLTATLLAFGAAGSAVADDLDADGTQDPLDFCTGDSKAPHPYGCDTDEDGYGNHCDADLDNDGVVGPADKQAFDAAFGTEAEPGSQVADLDCDGAVGMPDFALFGAAFDGAPGPSGLSCAGTIPCR